MSAYDLGHDERAEYARRREVDPDRERDAEIGGGPRPFRAAFPGTDARRVGQAPDEPRERPPVPKSDHMERLRAAGRRRLFDLGRRGS